MKACAVAAWFALAITPVLAQGDINLPYNGTTFPGSRQRVLNSKNICPSQCSGPGISENSWDVILSLDELKKCDKPLLFDTNIRFPLDAPGRQTYIRACVASSDFGHAGTPCVQAKNRTSSKVDIQVGWTNGNTKASLEDLISAAEDLERSASRDVSCGQTVLFAKTGDAVLGLFVGSEIDSVSVGPIFQEFIEFMNDRTGIPSDMAIQICDPDGDRSVTHTLGIMASASGSIEDVHAALGRWADAKCVTGFSETGVLNGKNIQLLPGADLTLKELRISGSDTFRVAQAECKYIQVESGNTCTVLAKRCGISTSKLIEFNGGKKTWCNRLMPKQPVCCSAGDVPDLRPSPNKDGTCAYHIIRAGDLCQTVQETYYLDSGDLEDFNIGKTWGWAGCGKIQPGQKICISDGRPPMPVWVRDAECGPQVVGTKQPTGDTEIADLNQCPLNVCCNIWGHCGTDHDFCIDTSIDDTPGTAKNGTFGCISNCGMDIVNNDDPPASFGRIAYFEAWNRERSCLHMDVTEIGDPHTHIHFAFGDITEDFQVSAKGTESQFKRMKGMKGINRIMSFGGWDFSNEAETSHIMRNGVKPENRQRFADNVVKFVEDNGLEGVDFDWEYPGADGTEGSDPGTPADGPNYLAFLKLVREGLGKDKILAIAAPASYWYLKHFPIEEISEVVSYIVYMTYDLHGQWDVDNKFVSPGCPEGNCLRSHVNSTITTNALAMVTKAGVKSNKIMIGITSYGRSFKMADQGCTGPMCRYLGERNQSPAMKGECTETRGYISDAETLKIKEDGKFSVQEYYDEDSDSDVLIYNKVEWVGWMSPITKSRRVNSYRKLNFAGASDWAVDLQGDIDSEDGETVYIGDDVYKEPRMFCDAPCTIVLAPSPLKSTTTISIPPYTTSIEVGRETVTVTITPKPITTTQIEFYNVHISDMEGSTTKIQPYPSLTVSDAVVTFTIENGDDTITSTRTLGLPPWPLITRGPPGEDEDWDEPPKIMTSDNLPTGTMEPPGEEEYHTPTWSWWQVPATLSRLKTSPRIRRLSGLKKMIRPRLKSPVIRGFSIPVTTTLVVGPFPFLLESLVQGRLLIILSRRRDGRFMGLYPLGRLYREWLESFLFSFRNQKQPTDDA